MLFGGSDAAIRDSAVVRVHADSPLEQMLSGVCLCTSADSGHLVSRTSGVHEANRPPPTGLEWLAKRRTGSQDAVSWGVAPVVLVNADAHRECVTRSDNFGERSSGGRSYRNDGEAQLAVRAACAAARGGDVRSVALLTPYRGQVRTFP